MAIKAEPWCSSEKENMTQVPYVITHCNSNIKHANIFKLQKLSHPEENSKRLSLVNKRIEK